VRWCSPNAATSVNPPRAPPAANIYDRRRCWPRLTGEHSNERARHLFVHTRSSGARYAAPSRRICWRATRFVGTCARNHRLLPAPVGRKASRQSDCIHERMSGSEFTCRWFGEVLPMWRCEIRITGQLVAAAHCHCSNAKLTPRPFSRCPRPASRLQVGEGENLVQYFNLTGFHRRVL